ncbi:nuclear transport factor 2 family protein [Streptomyces albireticuli]|uniref:SnoaL-like domain-containing protein n=1 Tax=Streptomyces albireticuli TaxID=1940 RepID=A0A2A2D865_9ACTN|nr:nuclear transport factor 2 family protein [Streptomyces albireticuli]MCD9193518.1 nuclear transport factor 2 family protein [Streptomyces albireticuli]PAU48668.1 hypothetical protein CK936_12045 [Streptomyces albireticuli]
MTDLAHEITELRRDVRTLADHAALTTLLDRFAAGLDSTAPDRNDETWYRSLFTEDVRLELPNGVHHGTAGLDGFLGAPKKAWARTHHLVTNPVVTVDGDRATGRANAHATHVPHPAEDGTTGPLFVGGAHYDYTAVRTADGWRVDALTASVVWVEGAPGA